MCGILLYLSDSKKSYVSEYLSSSKYIVPRGPDKTIYETIDNIHITFSRLAIMDLSSNGDQPFISDNIILVCNGEIYNHSELISEFNLECKSKSDCEVILHLYKKIGFFKTVQILDGDFAIVLIDKSINKVFVARDRIGVRPLFIGTTDQKTTCFSSLAKPLDNFCNEIIHLQPFMYEYLYNNEGTLKLLRQEPYIFNMVPLKESDEKYIPNLLKHYLIKSVKKRLMMDRPFACLLSGGLDSSLVTSILCKLLGPENVRTFSIGMEGSIDLKYAKQVADYLGTKHTEVLFTPEEGFNIIPELIEKLETYDITTIRASVGMYLLSKYISKNTDIKVLVSSEGVDELLCGYLYFHRAPSPTELHKESIRLVDNLYLYDILRADKTVSSNGLELRVPCLDKEFVDLCLSIPGHIKMPQDIQSNNELSDDIKSMKRMEKYILRYAFIDNYLPNNVLWRRKEGFSDGVSSSSKSWYEIIQESIDKIISNNDDHYILHSKDFPSKEAYYYKLIYDSIFSNYRPTIKYWMPRWIDTKGDPSGRLVNIE